MNCKNGQLSDTGSAGGPLVSVIMRLQTLMNEPTGKCKYHKMELKGWLRFMVFNSTFNNISVILWR